MIYLLYGTDDYLIEKELKKIKEKHNIDDLDINSYSMQQDKIEDIIDDCQTYSLFSPTKTVIINDSYAFIRKKNEIEQNFDILQNYLENPNPTTISIFIVKNQKLDNNKKIVKLIKKVGTVKELNNVNLLLTVKEMFGEYEITDNLINLLINRVGNSLELLNQEINKIKIYKDKDLKITYEDIINLTNQNIEADIFTLIDHIVSKDKKNALCLFRELSKNNEEPVVMIISLANKLRTIYQTKELSKRGYSENDIAKILDVKPGYLYYMKKSLNNYDSNTIINLLEKLATLDYKIKTNKIDKYLGFELFILEN